MRRLLKSIVPHFVRTLRGVNLAIKEHQKGQPLWQNVRQELLDGCAVLSDHSVMLDRLPKNAIVAEIGVAEGGFSRQILERAQPKRLHLIDPWDSSVPEYSETAMVKVRMQVAHRREVVEIARGYSCDVLASFPCSYFDWVYLDAAHDFENVRKDLDALYRTVKSGGLICGHDYIRWVAPTVRYGVVEAVNDFVNRTGSPFVFLTNQFDKHDNYAIRLNK